MPQFENRKRGTMSSLKERAKSKECRHCGMQFTFRISRGTDRVFCSARCQYDALEIRRKAAKELSPKCKTDGCERPATKKRSTICEACYFRIRRNGTVRLKPRKGFSVRPAGYVTLFDRSHPIATKSGMLYEHRKVVYDVVGDLPKACFWCSKSLGGWNEVVIDHLNEHKGDNRLENLKIVCNDCNRARGAMNPLVQAIKGKEARRVFIEAIERQWGESDGDAPRAATTV